MRTMLRILILCAAFALGVAPAAAQFSETVTITVQPFERGQMIWRADNGFIWVLANTGQLFEYAADVTEAPAITPAASSATETAAVFSDLYASSALVRNLIGAPADVETSFDALFGYANNTVSVTLLDGSLLLLGPGSTWSRMVETTPEPVAPALLSFGHSPEHVDAGDLLALDWAAEGVTEVEIEALDARGSSPLAALAALPAVGTETLAVPETAAGTIALLIYGAGEDTLTRTLLGSFEVTVRPLADTTATTAATYQAFENGFMLWRDDVSTGYVFDAASDTYTAYSDALVQTLADNPLTEAKAGYLLPDGVFGRIWGSDEAVQLQLGYALAPAQPYTMTIALYEGIPLAFTLPDDSEIALAAGDLWWPVE